jgi:putative restriction endonuclease
MNDSSDVKSEFSDFLRSTNVGNSGKASSYCRALELLEQMLRTAPLGFEDCRNVWTVDSIERLIELKEQVLKEQKLKSESKWSRKGIPSSYLRDGFCSAALTQLIEFLTQKKYSQKLFRILVECKDDASAVAKAIRIRPFVPDGFVDNPKSKDGKERIQSIKARIGQKTFRDLIMDIYQNRCCLTGIEVPEVNRASHIIGWAERADTRMDPRNGLCLSATYDAAFDRKLITFDDDYRLVLSKAIRDRMPTETLRNHFLNKEGHRIEMPRRLQPLKDYLAHHRQGGDF